MNTGSQPNQQPPQTEAPSAVRLAVFKGNGEQKRHLSTVTLKKSEGTAWSLEAGGPSAEELRPILEAFSEARRTLAAGTAGSPVPDASPGFVAKYMGDGVLVYFGYPQAHEDDAERSVRAGVELIAAVTALKSPVPMQTRVGIATGLVVVGDLLGSGEAQERGIVGGDCQEFCV